MLVNAEFTPVSWDDKKGSPEPETNLSMNDDEGHTLHVWTQLRQVAKL